MTPEALLERRERRTTDRDTLLRRYLDVRRVSVELCGPLEPEDYRIQSMADVSPPWWNLGHTSWFFAKNVLEPFGGSYGDPDESLEFVLNSYYVALGPRIARDNRGKVGRPTTERVYAFRESVDERMERLIRECGEEEFGRVAAVTNVGIHHEQQHQELLLTEVKHIFGFNPPELREAYVDAPPAAGGPPPEAAWVELEGGLHEFGHLEGGWCWDNELPVHRAFLEPFALGNRLVTVGEYLEFIDDGGYDEPLLWLQNGWAAVEENGWRAPLYWEDVDGEWRVWTLGGDRPLDPDEPVCHVGFYEADAFARWKSRQGGRWEGARLPFEREWELAARTHGFDAERGHFMEAGGYHPLPAEDAPGRELLQMEGDVWEWTVSHYEPYPGFRPFEGDLQEYNGKFMDNQRVLRGGSCATPASHIRVAYRNFWPPTTRFQFTGIRLARSP